MASFFNLVIQNPSLLLFPIPIVSGIAAALAAVNLRWASGKRPTLLDILNHRYWRRVWYVLYPVGVISIFVMAIRAAQQGAWFATVVNGALVVMFIWGGIVGYHRRYKRYIEKRSDTK